MQYDFGKIMEPMEKEGPSVLESVGATRSLFENAARKVVMAQCANITPQYGAAVSALKVEGGSVAGAALLHPPMRVCWTTVPWPHV